MAYTLKTWGITIDTHSRKGPHHNSNERPRPAIGADALEILLCCKFFEQTLKIYLEFHEYKITMLHC